MPTRKPLYLNALGFHAEFDGADTVPQSAVPDGIALSKLAQSGASTGQVVMWDGSAWVPANSGAGVFPEVETPENVRTSNFTAISGRLHLVDVSSNSVTVTPPSAPSVNSSFGVSDARGAVTINNRIIVAFGTQKLCGQTNIDYELITAYSTAVFVYAGASTGWICITRG
jgi:hypothetical protein